MKRFAVLATMFLFTFFFSLTWVIGQEKPQYGGTLTFGIRKTVTKINPHNWTRVGSFWITNTFLEGLVGLDSKGNVAPALAESWDLSKDGKVYSFHLRKGVKFHNGREFEAQDVKWNFENMMDKKVGSQRVNELERIDSIELLDRYTVRVILKEPFAPFLAVIADSFVSMIPKESWPTADSKPVGTGPFQFSEYFAGNYIKLKRFPDYWQRGIPYVDELMIRRIPDDTVRTVGLRTRELDIIDGFPLMQAGPLLKNPPKEFRLIAVPSWSVAIIAMNNSRAPFNDIRVRKAVGYAINKEEIARPIDFGLGEISNQYYPKGNKWFANIEDPFTKPNVKKAKELLAEAGYPGGFSMDMPVEQAFSLGVKAAQILQSQLEKVGIKVKLEMMETAAYYVKRKQSDFDMLIFLSPFREDPCWSYQALYSKSFENYTCYNNPEFERIYNEAARTSIFEERKRLYTRLVEIINQDVPQIFISNYPEVYGVGARVQGFQPNSLATPDYVDGGMRKAWIKK